MDIINVHIEKPLFLLLGLATAIIFVLGHLVRNTGSRSQLLVTTVLRALGILCLSIALAGPALIKTNKRTAVIFAVDSSASITEGSTTASAAEKAITVMKGKLTKDDMAGIVEFGSDAIVSSPPTSTDKLTFIRTNVDASGTDLAKALKTGALSLPEGYSGKIVLLSDGHETMGDAASEAKQLSASGIVVDTVALGGTKGTEVSMRSLMAPERIKINETFDVKAVVESSKAQSADVIVSRNGMPVSKQTVALKAGLSTFYLRENLSTDGPVVYEAQVIAKDDGIASNNRADTVVTVNGPPKVLVIGESEIDSKAFINMLGKQGIPVQWASPASAPKDLASLNAFDSIVLNDLSAIHFSDAYLSLLKSYVEDLGGGLVAIGGQRSFGMGGYRNTPLEDILPVSMDIRQKLKFPSMSLAIVLDRSGSMAGEGQGATKLDLAKEATMSVVDLLPDDAHLGVITFDSEHEWTVPLGEAKNKDDIAEKLSSVQTGGGTQLYPPLVTAYKELIKAKSVIKHVIAITDGRSEPGDFADVTKKMAAAGITVSTVAIGDDSDRPLLEAIAAGGGGRSYYTNDIYAIPRIFVTEAFMASRSLMVENPFKPEVRTIEPALKGIDTTTMPPLNGRLLAVAKPGASTHLEGDGDPVLATWRTGLGRSVAFLSDVSGRWSKPWLKWSEAPKLWSGLVRWSMRSWQASPLVATASIKQQTLVIAVDAIDSNGKFIDLLELKARVARANDKSIEVPLEQTGPGRYEVQVPLTKPGSVLAVISDTANRVQPQTVSASLPYPDELRIRPVNTSFLASLASTTKGKLTTPANFSPRAGLEPTKVPKELWPGLLVATLILFLLDLTVRTLPEDVWASLTSPGIHGSSLRSTLDSVVSQQANSPKRYEEMIWNAKAGEQTKAADRRYLGEITPSRSANLYLARLKKLRRLEEEEDKDGHKN